MSLFQQTELIAVGIRGPFQTKFIVVPNRRFYPQHTGFDPKAVAVFTKRVNRLSHSSHSHGQEAP